MKSSSKTPRSSFPALGTAGLGLVAILCCAGPALITGGFTAGALGAFGVWVSNPWVLGAAIVLAVLAVAGAVARRRLTGRMKDRWGARSDNP